MSHRGEVIVRMSSDREVDIFVNYCPRDICRDMAWLNLSIEKAIAIRDGLNHVLPKAHPPSIGIEFEEGDQE